MKPISKILIIIGLLLIITCVHGSEMITGTVESVEYVYDSDIIRLEYDYTIVTLTDGRTITLWGIQQITVNQTVMLSADRDFDPEQGKTDLTRNYIIIGVVCLMAVIMGATVLRDNR